MKNFPAHSRWLLPKPGVESGQLAAGYEFKTIEDLLSPQIHFVFLPAQLMFARPVVDEGVSSHSPAGNELETQLNAVMESSNSIENESQMIAHTAKGGKASAEGQDSEEVLMPASTTDIMKGSEYFVNSESSIQPFPKGDDPYQLPKPMVSAGYRPDTESYRKNLISEKAHLNYRDIGDILRARLQVKGNKIVVYPNETIGHFADWLNIRASRLRRQNKIEYGKPIYAGQVLRLDFSATSIEEFSEKRLRYHTNLVIQLLEGKTEIRFVEHRVNPGENLWTLAHKRNNFPVNLLLYFNDLNKLEQLYPGDIIKLPIL
ncbi:MAG: LysM peptidoglycan-binding domain-containing protein [Calditrichia bacterium]